MRAGALINRITVRIRSAGGTGSYGRSGPTYSDGATLWASVRTPAGAAEVVGGQPRSKLTHVFEVRYPEDDVRATLNPTNSIRFGGRELQIVWAADPTGLHEVYRIGCEELMALTPATFPAAGD